MYLAPTHVTASTDRPRRLRLDMREAWPHINRTSARNRASFEPALPCDDGNRLSVADTAEIDDASMSRRPPAHLRLVKSRQGHDPQRSVAKRTTRPPESCQHLIRAIPARFDNPRSARDGPVGTRGAPEARGFKTCDGALGVSANHGAFHASGDRETRVLVQGLRNLLEQGTDDAPSFGAPVKRHDNRRLTISLPRDAIHLDRSITTPHWGKVCSGDHGREFPQDTGSRREQSNASGQYCGAITFHPHAGSHLRKRSRPASNSGTAEGEQAHYEFEPSISSSRHTVPWITASGSSVHGSGVSQEPCVLFHSNQLPSVCLKQMLCLACRGFASCASFSGGSRLQYL